MTQQQRIAPEPRTAADALLELPRWTVKRHGIFADVIWLNDAIEAVGRPEAAEQSVPLDAHVEALGLASGYLHKRLASAPATQESVDLMRAVSLIDEVLETLGDAEYARLVPARPAARSAQEDMALREEFDHWLPYYEKLEAEGLLTEYGRGAYESLKRIAALAAQPTSAEDSE